MGSLHKGVEFRFDINLKHNLILLRSAVPDFDAGAIDVTILLPYLLTPQQSGVQEQRKLCTWAVALYH